MKKYSITEAFKALDMLNESETFDVSDKSDLEDAQEFLNTFEDEENIEMVVDMEAETEEDLQDSYIGNVIVKCSVCNTLIYKKPEDITENEEDATLCTIDHECPKCKSEDQFLIIGKVAPFRSEEEASVIEEPFDDEEPIEDEIDTDQEVSEDENNQEVDDSEEVNDEQNNEEESIEAAIEKEDKKKNESKKTYKEFNIDNLDENKFNSLVEKYLKAVYANVNTFETTNCHVNDVTNQLIVEGKINFTSGKSKATKFIFEAKNITKKGMIKFTGFNEAFSKNKRSFTLTGKLVESNLISTNLTYNYSVKNKALNEAKKISGKATNLIK